MISVYKEMIAREENYLAIIKSEEEQTGRTETMLRNQHEKEIKRLNRLIRKEERKA